MIKQLMRKTKESLLRNQDKQDGSRASSPSQATSRAPSESSTENPPVKVAQAEVTNTSKWVGQQDKTFYIAVVVREARNLTIWDALQRSSDRELPIFFCFLSIQNIF